MAEARPDAFIRYDYFKLLDESRAAVAELIKAPVANVVFVSNATEGINTVFRNLEWADDAKDVVLFFSTAYASCAKTVYYLVDYTRGKLEARPVELKYPVEDEDVLAAFRAAVKDVEAAGKRARACMFDVVSSLPGVVFPWEAMVKACRELGVLSVVDGAHAVGMVPLDVGAADPDFFVSNCHKWLFTARGTAVLYVPERNHGLLPTTLATSHWYEPKSAGPLRNPLPPSSKSHFVRNFEFVGTRDNAGYLLVADAIRWRRERLGGEARIMAYLWGLNRRGTDHVAAALGTEVLENRAGTLRNSPMGVVGLPVWVGEAGEGAREGDVVLPREEAQRAFNWMLETMVDDYKTFVALFAEGGRFWARLSAQVYLDMEDYEFAAVMLGELVERVRKGEYREEK
jgi:selenocysteine lyase/cysteine desulfurase